MWIYETDIIHLQLRLYIYKYEKAPKKKDGKLIAVTLLMTPSFMRFINYIISQNYDVHFFFFSETFLD